MNATGAYTTLEDTNLYLVPLRNVMQRGITEPKQVPGTVFYQRGHSTGLLAKWSVPVQPIAMLMHCSCKFDRFKKRELQGVDTANR